MIFKYRAPQIPFSATRSGIEVVSGGYKHRWCTASDIGGSIEIPDVLYQVGFDVLYYWLPEHGQEQSMLLHRQVMPYTET
jgi:hypothetical protein